MASLCYYYWKSKGIRPSVIYNMPRGEQLFVMACFELEMEEKKKLYEKGLSCPFAGL